MNEIVTLHVKRSDEKKNTLTRVKKLLPVRKVNCLAIALRKHLTRQQ